MEGAQGQFAEKDNESNETFFELRNYDPLLGRFSTIDPYGQYFSPYLAMGNSHPNMIDPDGGFGGPFGMGYTASNPFLGTAGVGGGGTSGLQILGSVSGVLSAAMMGNAFAFQNAVGELNASVTYTETPKSNNWWGNFWNKPIGIKAGEFKTQKEYEDFKQSNKGDETAAEAAEWAGALVPFGGGIKITFSLKGIFKSIANLFTWRGLSKGSNRITANTLKEFKDLIWDLSKYGSEINTAELRQLEKLTERFGGKIRFDLNPIKGRVRKPHVQIEGLGSQVHGRKIWLGKGVK